MPSDRAAEPDGRLAGRYRIGRLLGSGGGGIVREGEDTLLRRRVAIKEVRLPPMASQAERDLIGERVLREARAAARLHHPGLVTVYDVIDADDHPWIVMEYVDGLSLAEIVRESGPLSPAGTARIGISLAYALEALHRAGVVHRDVKLGNVLINQEGRARLTDFGIAQTEGDATLTGTGMLLGSPAYIAPERARGASAGAAGDIWGLGATLFAAVEGEPPFAGEGAIATLAAVVEDRRRPFRHAGALREVLTELMDSVPGRRPSLAEARGRLREIAERYEDDGTERPTAATGTAVPPARAYEGETVAGPVGSVPAGTVPVGFVPAGAVPDGSVPAGTVPVGSVPAGAVPDGSVPPPRRTHPRPTEPVDEAYGAREVDGSASTVPVSSTAGTAHAGTPDAPGNPGGRLPDPSDIGLDVLTDEGPVADPSPPAGSEPATAGSTSAGPTASYESTAGGPPTPEPTGPEVATRPAPAPEPGPLVDLGPPTAEAATGPAAPGGGGTESTPATTTRTGAPLGGSGRPSHSRTILLAVVLAALVVAAAVTLALMLSGGSSGPGPVAPATTAPTARPSRSGGSPGASASPSLSPSAGSNATATASATSDEDLGELVPTTTAPAAAPRGFESVRNPAGWSVALPTGWAAKPNDGGKDFSAASGYPFLRIQAAATAGPSAIRAWREQEAGVRTSSQDYRLISFRPADGKDGTNAAVWEFSVTMGGQTIHELDLGVVRNGHGYALLWREPEDKWQDGLSLMRTIFATFRPGS